MLGIRDMLNEIRRVLPEGETVPFQTLARSKDFKATRQVNKVIFEVAGGAIINVDFAEFQHVLYLLGQEPDGVNLGNIIQYGIGHERCPLNSVDGSIAHDFYGIPIGGTHTKRSTYIAPVLYEAGLINFVQNPIMISLLQEED